MPDSGASCKTESDGKEERTRRGEAFGPLEKHHLEMEIVAIYRFYG